MPAPARSRGRCASCPRPSRTPWTGCPRHAVGRTRRARRSATRRRWPSAAAPRGSRTGGPDAEGQQFGAPAHPDRRDVVGRRPIRRAQPGHDQRVAGPGVPGPDRRGRTGGAGPPRGRRARPHVVEHRQQLGRVERAVTVHERDVLGGGGEQSGVHRGAVARRRSSVTTVAPSRRATSAVPSREPLSTTITRNPSGTSRQQRLERRPPRHGREDQVADRSTSAPHASTSWRRTGREPVALTNRDVHAWTGAAVRRLGSRLATVRLRGLARSRWLALVLVVRIRAPPLVGLGCRDASPAQRLTDEVPPLHGLWQPKLFGPGHAAGARVALARVAVRRRPGRAAPVAPAAGRVVRRLAGLAALAGVRRRQDRASRGCWATRTSTCSTAREVGSVPQLIDTYIEPDPLRRRRQLADARGRAPARDPAVLRRAGPRRARRRLRRRDGGHGAGRDHRGRRARDPAGAGRRGRGRAGRRRSWC